jgi:Fur family ferric uptake transcriptional regulator
MDTRSHSKDDIYNFVKSKGYRITAQRKIVLDIILNDAHEHYSTEEIYKKAKNLNYNIGIATIYRNMSFLEQIGVIHRLTLNDGSMRYQVNDSNKRHYHLVCEKCGNVIDMKDNLIENLENQVYLQYGFKVTNHQIQIFGLCKKCLDSTLKLI